MPRPRTTSERVQVTLPKGALALLDQLVSRGLYGESRSEVARHLIIAAIDDLVGKGRLVEDGK